MRTLASGERALIAGVNVTHFIEVEVENIDRDWISLSNLLGNNLIISGEWGEDGDSTIGTFTIELLRDANDFAALDPISLAPLIGASGANRNTDGTLYSPLLDSGRNIRISTATVALGVDPYVTSGAFVEVFRGVIDEVNWEHSPMTIKGRDLGGWLVDTLIFSEFIIIGGPDAVTGPVDLEVGMQYLLDSAVGVAPPYFPDTTLYTPVSPSFAIVNSNSNFQARKSLMEALQQDYAGALGWICRYRYDSAGDCRLTFYDPGRTSASSMTTFSADEYEEITELKSDGLDVRNYVLVKYFDDAGGAQTAFQVDSVSIAAYGLRAMEIALPLGDVINTAIEAQALADVAIADLSLPVAQQSVRTPYFWPAQLHDTYTFSANGDHYDDHQIMHLGAYKHRFAEGQITTEMTLRGRMVGALKAWQRRGGDGPTTIGPGTGDVTRPGTVEILSLIDVYVPDDPVFIPYTKWTLKFQLNQYASYAATSTSPKQLGADNVQVYPYVSGPVYVDVSQTVDDFGSVTVLRIKPAHVTATGEFSVEVNMPSIYSNLQWRIRGSGNLYTTAFVADVTTPQNIRIPAEGRQVGNVSAYLSNNRTFNIDDFFDSSRLHGTTDDATFWQAAVTAAVSAFTNGRQAHLEVPSDLLVATDLTCPRNLSIYGSGIGDSMSIHAATQKSLKITGSAPAKHIMKDLQLDKVNVIWGATSSDYGRGNSMENVLIQGCTGVAALIQRYHSYLTNVINCHFTGNKRGVQYDFATAGSDSGAKMCILNSTIDVCEDALYIDGMTADGCQIFVTDSDLEHTTNSVMKSVGTGGEGLIKFHGCNLELNTGYVFDNAHMQIWLENFMALSVTELAFIKQSGGLFFLGKGRMSWTQYKFALLTGGKIIVDPGMLFTASRFHSEGSAGSGSGFGAAVPYAVAGSGGGKIILPGQNAFLAQHNQALTALTHAAPGPVAADVWWKLDGNNRTWELDIVCPFTGSPTSNTLRMDITNGLTTVRIDAAFPLFAGHARLTVVNTAGVSFKAFGSYVETVSGKVTKQNYSTTDYASATDCDRALMLETLGTTKAPMTVTVVHEYVTGPIFVGL